MSRNLHRLSHLLFDAGAPLYRRTTSQAVWEASCAALARHFPPSPPALRILDVGCGPGVSAIALARVCPAARLVGADISPGMLAQARDAIARAGLSHRITLVQGDAGDLPFATGVFDVVTAHSVLYLVPDRARLLAEARRVLRPGGRVVVMEPHARRASLSTWLRYAGHIRFLLSALAWRAYSRLHGRFTSETLAQTLAAAGFVAVQVEPVLSGFGLLARGERP